MLFTQPTKLDLAIVGKTAKSNYKVPPAKAGKTPKKERKGWDETVDVAIRLGVDPKHADQMVRGAVVLPGWCALSVG